LKKRSASLIHTVHALNRFGVTSVIDAGNRGYPKHQATVDVLARDDRLNVRMPFVDMQFGDGTPMNMVDAQLEAITKTAPISPGENLHPSLEHGHVYRGAGEVLQLEVHDHENFDRPAVVIDPDQMRRHVEQNVAKLVQRRIPFRMHISYDENISPFLDALEELDKTTPLNGLKWSIEHAETISPANIARVKALGGGIALDPKMALHGDGFIKTHGREKALMTPRLRQLVDSGIPLADDHRSFPGRHLQSLGRHQVDGSRVSRSPGRKCSPRTTACPAQKPSDCSPAVLRGSCTPRERWG
jgi:predicted amidohydrolase YtcJ